jgi:hypothetical protein
MFPPNCAAKVRDHSSRCRATPCGVTLWEKGREGLRSQRKAGSIPTALVTLTCAAAGVLGLLRVLELGGGLVVDEETFEAPRPFDERLEAIEGQLVAAEEEVTEFAGAADDRGVHHESVEHPCDSF